MYWYAMPQRGDATRPRRDVRVVDWPVATTSGSQPRPDGIPKAAPHGRKPDPASVLEAQTRGRTLGFLDGVDVALRVRAPASEVAHDEHVVRQVNTQHQRLDDRSRTHRRHPGKRDRDPRPAVHPPQCDSARREQGGEHRIEGDESPSELELCAPPVSRHSRKMAERAPPCSAGRRRLASCPCSRSRRAEAARLLPRRLPFNRHIGEGTL